MQCTLPLPPAPLAPRLRCRRSEPIPLQGFGVFWSKSGDRYEGEWKDGKRNGKGRQIYGGRFPDGFGGDVYEGDWVQDKRHGQGVMEARPPLAPGSMQVFPCLPSGALLRRWRTATASMASGRTTLSTGGAPSTMRNMAGCACSLPLHAPARPA